MAKIKPFLIITALIVLISGVSGFAGEVKFRSDSGSLNGVAVTTSQTAVFAAFLSDIPDVGVSTAISVSNPLTASFTGVVTSSLTGDSDTQGTLHFFLYDRDGSQVAWDTGMDPTIGIGLNSDGTLGPGQTYTVLLRDILNAAGASGNFNGHGVLVANLDAVVGTYNVTIFGLGFTQNFEFLPGPYQGIFQAGVPVSPGN